LIEKCNPTQFVIFEQTRFVQGGNDESQMYEVAARALSRGVSQLGLVALGATTATARNPLAVVRAISATGSSVN
jgi:hypothetical protein